VSGAAEVLYLLIGDSHQATTVILETVIICPSDLSRGYLQPFDELTNNYLPARAGFPSQTIKSAAENISFCQYLLKFSSVLSP
jgi:hypothetical protein